MNVEKEAKELDENPPTARMEDPNDPEKVFNLFVDEYPSQRHP